MQTLHVAKALVETPLVLHPSRASRLRASGNFLWCGDEKFYIKGVSYGTFAPNGCGEPFPERTCASHDLQRMRAAGFNSIRTYDVPPTWLLDLAADHGMRVLVGIPWAQHLTLADTRGGRRALVRAIADGVRVCAAHPAVLAYCIGNEIPTQIVRWYGKRDTEHLLRSLCEAAKSIDPEGLVTYANYPSTEYLELPFLDFHCFNVYLHGAREFRAYLARLQMLVGSQPLCVSEYGLDALRHGETAQAEMLQTQTRDIFQAGCCGAIAFAWTDEWFRGGAAIRDWQFGITDAARQPKRAYAHLQRVLRDVPFAANGWPRISVIVAAYNASATLDDCLTSLLQSHYPNVEVVVVDDGSRDDTGAIADAHAHADARIKVLHVLNNGLSVARNLGLARATCDIVAYTDADCRVDADWLHYVALKLLNSDVVGVGGPNLVPPDDGLIAQAVGLAPGNPMHVMLSDEIAEHIPGCNMAYWKWVLDDVGGFRPVYRAAGDDVDICWRLQARGYRIGFAPAALVWHHRRNSLRAYLKQQVGYGHAESLLEREQPEKFNGLGQVRWAGRVYAPLATRVLNRARIYQGVFGSAPFQSLYQPSESLFAYLPQTPEWYVLLALLFALSIVNPLIALAPLCGVLWQVALCARAALSLPTLQKGGLQLRWLIFIMHLVQPLARSWGRLQGGLGPFRWTRGERTPDTRTTRTHHGRSALRSFIFACWGEDNQDKDNFLRAVMGELFNTRCVLDTNTGWEDWDVQIARGLSARAHLLVATEYHGGPKVLLRSKVRLGSSPLGLAGVSALVLLGAYLLLKDFGLGSVDNYLDALGIALPIVGVLWLLWQRAQLAVRIDEALQRAAEHLNLKVIDSKAGRS